MLDRGSAATGADVKEAATMAGKQRPPYFRVAFRGTVRTVTEEMAWEGHWRRRTYLDFGRYRLKDVVTCPRMDRVLDECGSDPDAVVRLGHFLVWRWVLSVSRGGRVERQAFLLFALGLLAITAVFAGGGFVCLFICIGVLETVDGVLPGLAFPVLWATHMAMNLRAWLGT
ncbi:hypothetical protein [Thauera sp. Sel9]|uniref:hypothetical protein n=1 Tax=Thauera sp. Sel9 TaxID=2974299 RepID=UPI0021E17288|nr:hypothetical protein [Thauera sp. Sel9]MCV2217246.1 hypothetical protein [Thauera sp. Sel9]